MEQKATSTGGGGTGGGGIQNPFRSSPFSPARSPNNNVNNNINNTASPPPKSFWMQRLQQQSSESGSSISTTINNGKNYSSSDHHHQKETPDSLSSASSTLLLSPLPTNHHQTHHRHHHQSNNVINEDTESIHQLANAETTPPPASHMTSLEESQHLKRIICSLQKEMTNLELKRIEAEETATLLSQSTIVREKKLTSQLSHLENSVRSLSTQNESLLEEKAELEMKNEELETKLVQYEMEISHLLSQITFLSERERKSSKMEEQLMEDVKIRRNMEPRVMEVIEEQERLLEKISSLQNENSQMEQNFREIEAEKSKLKMEISKLKMDVTILKEGEEIAISRKRDAEQHTKCLLEVNKRLDEENNMLKQRVGVLEKKMEEERQEKMELEGKLQEVCRAAQISAEKANRLEVELDEQKRRFVQAEREALRFMDKVKDFIPKLR